MLRAALHVRRADVQREGYQRAEAAAIACKQSKKDHTQSSYTLVVDYGQNMELPTFSSEQPGMTYYFSPLTVNNLGIVDHAHVNEDGSVVMHMHAHVYHEGVGKKGANNVASLLTKTLKDNNIIRENESGFKLTVVFDNCTGQNKNNTVLKLVPYYVEMGYFQEVEFLFLIVGHTKNACDRYFNQLKRLSRRENTYTMEEMYERLADCEDVTIYRTQASDFKDMSAFLNQFYNDYSGMIKQHHIFRCTIHDIDSEEGKVYVQFRQSLLPDDEPVRMNVKKANFANKDDFVDEEAAFEYRKTIMADLESEVHVVKQKGLNPYKKYEMWSKYGSMVDESARQDPIYAKPCEEDLEKVLKERGMRKRFRDDVAELKEWGDLEKTRVKREDKDKALDILDRIAGLKK